MFLQNIFSVDQLKIAFESRYFKIAIGVAVVVISGKYLLKYINKRKRDQKHKSYPKDVVILHQFPRGLRAPSFSPFPLKLETWLRMAKIPYKSEFGFEFSSKLLIPWITYNDVDVADSQFCIEYLSKTLNKDFNSHLTDYQRGVAQAVLKLAEESLRWAGILHRVVYHPDPDECGVSYLILRVLKGRVLERTWAQGYGRHSKEEVYEIGKKDLKALNDLIGKNKFIFGDKPCDVDCTVFGITTQVLVHDRGSFNEYTQNECPNIIRHFETMKQTFWPDWNEHIREGKKKH